MSGSRLDRLIQLFETGSTASVRLTAARQLGQIAGTRVAHPSVKAEIDSNNHISGEEVSLWRGVDGEWNEVIQLVARVSSLVRVIRNPTRHRLAFVWVSEGGFRLTIGQTTLWYYTQALPHLQSRSSETRQAAAAALGFISKAVGMWDPTSTAAPTSTPLDDNVYADLSDRLSLDQFDVMKVLSEGSLLLSSSGNEYGNLSHLSAEELARAQREAMTNLGLGIGGPIEQDLGVDVSAELAAGVETVSTTAPEAAQVSTPTARSILPLPKFKNEGAVSAKTLPAFTSDVPVASTSKLPIVPEASGSPATNPPVALTSNGAVPADSIPVVATPPEAEDEFAGLSARERNKLKRKRKMEAKSTTNGGTGALSAASLAAPPAKIRVVDAGNGTPATTTSQSNVKSEAVVIDPQARAKEREVEKQRQGGEVMVDSEAQNRAEMEVKAGEWPWRGTVERLAVALLSPNWETRHGAALGLKEVLKLQGRGGGQIAGLTVAANLERHRRWSEDVAAKLLCVFALDRFGDYNADHVVAPVRETAAQALATLLPCMAPSSVVLVQRLLIAMIDQDGAPPSRGLSNKRDTDAQEPNTGRRVSYAWQVRHSGLLGLTYLVTVKGDMLRIKAEPAEDVKPTASPEVVQPTATALLKEVIDAALLGLRDGDDDVRSAAAATLVSVSDALVASFPVELATVVEVLWECLGDLKDDLSSSVGGVMNLLASLLGYPPVLALVTAGRPLADLVPRLYPFFRHTITSVRVAVLNTILVFLQLPSSDLSWADDRLLRLLFQNLVVENKAEIRASSARAWQVLLSALSSGTGPMARLASPHIATWFTLVSMPIGTPLNTAFFWSARTSLSGTGGYVYNVDRPMISQDLALVSVEGVTKTRLAAAVALGQLIAAWPFGTHDSTFSGELTTRLASTSAFERFLGATIIEEWGAAAAPKLDRPLAECSTLASRLVPSLHAAVAADPPESYMELESILVQLNADCLALYAAFSAQGKVSKDKIPQVPKPFRIVHARQIDSSYQPLVGFVSKSAAKTALPQLEERHGKIKNGLSQWESSKASRDRQVSAAIAGAIVALRVIPAKLTPLVRSLNNAVKLEEDPEIQARSASAIAAFIDLCSAPGSTIKANPSDKIVKNLCTFLCQDETRTPIFSDEMNAEQGILTLKYTPARGEAVKENKERDVESPEVATARVTFRGAQLALAQLSIRFGDLLLERVPRLWSGMSEGLLAAFASGDVHQADQLLATSADAGQSLLDCLTVLPIGAKRLNGKLQGRLVQLLPSLTLAIRSKFAVVRFTASKCFAALCDIIPVEGLKHVVEGVVPVVGDPVNVHHRRGAVELVSHLVDLLDIKILPYVIFLIVPILGRMSDPDDDTRLVATNTFAALIKIVPLEAGLPDPPGFPADLLEKRQAERDFLTQLLDGQKVAEYKIPIPIGIELRKYQRDGVSWLAFLAKYQLHGLLCDDMGLGKTLQSICILGSMHHERAELHKKTGSPDTVHLPSLVICPPTLTGHWQQEIKTYAPFLRCVTFVGPKAFREQIGKTLGSYDVVITSYEVTRNEIDTLAKQDWHYCILDEGHIIKNGKTKLTKSVKMLRAIHRLILSGTPIQNNVLELWSLFDFLMPGFLGSEKAFNERFGKPIAASRDAKSSSKEQEQGALALEALHKQVLPFLLRRLKEDVLDDLPPKIIQDYYVELSPLQKDLYDDFSKSKGQQLVDGGDDSGSSGGNPQHVFQALQYLRKLVNHPSLVFNPDSPRHQHALQKTGSPLIRDVVHAPKLDALRQILLDCGIGTPTIKSEAEDEAVPQHRVLIFCQLKQMLDIVERDLFRALMPSVTYMRLDGSTDVSKRHAVVQTFNADPSIDCLLLTTHVGGLGLNLTGADTVIFVEHDWNPMKDLQAMDRAHRLGQKKVVNVYRLIMRGTLEEKIMGLQKFKLNIASSVVTQQNSDLATLGTEGILDLFQVTPEGAAPPKVDPNKPTSRKAILAELGDLPIEDECESLRFPSRLRSVRTMLTWMRTIDWHGQTATLTSPTLRVR
ncbi:BQ2448_6533 [Microbotryum intermedium]|uniref:BQ2448_6533 protein n=1 Tax=Microbotryum intermedium TaxID=269621 RepID=A0A238FPH0_9BASI|nr:BQ2448_6533 [Microbotryum intermedium]